VLFRSSGADPVAGGASYKLTIAASGSTGVTWKSSDTTIATVAGTDILGTVVALKAGTAIITATGGNSVSVPLTVMNYAAADLSAGRTAFETTYTCAKSGCHDAMGPDVTPSGVGKHTDAQLQAVVTSGMNPEGGVVSIGAAAHSFAIVSGTPAYAGIVAYMRSLPPGTPKQDM
jgi:hypothetical protein